MFTILSSPCLPIYVGDAAITCERRVAVLVESLEACAAIEAMRIAAWSTDNFTTFTEPAGWTFLIGRKDRKYRKKKW
jgi:hypothetical protein